LPEGRIQILKRRGRESFKNQINGAGNTMDHPVPWNGGTGWGRKGILRGVLAEKKQGIGG